MPRPKSKTPIKSVPLRANVEPLMADEVKRVAAAHFEGNLSALYRRAIVELLENMRRWEKEMGK